MTIDNVIGRIRSPRLREQLLNIAGQVQNIALLTPSKVYYVWKGGDNSTGENWTKAFTTLAAAITAQRAMRALEVAACQSVDSWIVMAPGLYEENITTFPFSTTILGLGVLGTDKSTEIHPAVGSCMAGTVSGLRLYNISFQGGTGTADTLDFNIANNVHIEGCEFMPGNAASNAAISFQTAGNTVIRGNHIITQAALYYTYGIYCGGGADKYFIGCRVEDNIMTGLAATGTGIHIQSTCTCSGQTIIRNNVIRLAGAGVGIDDDSDGCIVMDNKIFHVGGTPYDINTALSCNNFANDNGTATIVPDLAQF